MSAPLRFDFFAHSWVSDWNHGNAHFLRGLVRALIRKGHVVRCYEQLGAWSLTNLVRTEGERAIEAIDQFRAKFPELDVQFYKGDESFREFAAERLKDSDIAVIHEWNEPAVVNTILELKQELGFKALFHDTHHRAYTSPRDILRLRMDLFDGVLAFGETIRRIYSEGFGIPRTWTFHEAADPDHFHPLSRPKSADVLWIGNWGDEERTPELEEFLIEPAMKMPGMKVVVHGVRYPAEALRRLAEAKVEFRGYLPNLRAPEAYAASRLSLHVPRRQYTNGLSGVPTIRVFEALACGAPLLCAPWLDSEGLFRPGHDYLVLENGDAMKAEIDHLLRDDRARTQLAAAGMTTVLAKHTCTHRADQLLEICEELDK